MASIEEKMKKLSPELQVEVENFIDFLLEKAKRRPERKLRLDWAG